MKRFFYIMFTCACALFTFVSNAEAQTTGDIVTIKTKDDNNYLAVDDEGKGIVNFKGTTPNENCYWRVTDSGNSTYAFQSIISGLYLTINTNSLSLEEDPQNITWNNKLSVKPGRTTYYIRYNSGWTTTDKNNRATTLTLNEVQYNTGHKFTLMTPPEGVTQAFNTITLTTDVEMADLEFDAYHPDNNKKIKFTHTAANGTVTTLYVLQGLAVKFGDNRQTLIITINGEYGDGTYKLDIDQGAVKGKADGLDFQQKSYEWTVKPHTFVSIAPETLEPGKHLETITVSATNNVAMSIADASKIVLKNAGDVTIPTTATVDEKNQLVITPVAALGNGTYRLTIEDGAVLGPNSVNFVGKSKEWSVIVSVSITHVNGFYNALGAGGYQNVHTVERTIYYTGNETSIPLELAETNFFGYMRWYNYATDGGEDINWITPPRARNNANFEPITGSAKHLGWFAWAKTKDNGVLDRQSNEVSGNNTPAIDVSGWTENRTIACDVSNYLDYTITRVDDNIVGITEPRLSYRQLFHFRPASEMADKFEDLEDGEYLEEYTYMAPTGTDVYLSTKFRYDGDNAENCYFYYDGGQIKRVTSDIAKWSAGTTKGAFRVVSSTDAGTQEYTLTANSGNLRIAKFTVTYVNKNTYGPVKEEEKEEEKDDVTVKVTKALISYEDMNNLYEVLEYNNFNFNQKSSTAEHYLDAPLPYIESTYGFYYNANKVKANSSIQHNSSLPYYGEYGIVNRLTSQSWALGANHVDGITDDATAGAQGYALYVDGTSEPGVVASISTKATICGERTMYCSVWLRNPGSSNTKPIFRCNVQGRNQLSTGEYTPWEDVAVYFVGDLGFSSGWNQVNFPFVSQDTYSECRVQIYNFGLGVFGNDFWLDDLCIYADKLPMSSYQLQTEMCCSPNHDGTTFTAAVLRVDYGINTLHETGSSGYQYYQIYNKTTGKPFVLTSTSLSPYYNEHSDYQAPNLTKEQYGSIEIKAANYEPSQAEILANPSELVSKLLEAYHLDTKETKTAPLCGKCFVAKRPEEITTESPGDYYMYVVHIIPNISDNRIQENYLQEHCEYTLRMTNDAKDLLDKNLSCAVEIDLPATQQSLFRLMSDQIETTEFLCNSTNNCANELYTLEAFIRKDSDPYSDAGNAEGTYLADWMYGHAFDEVYRMDYPHANDEAEHAAQTAADNQFEAAYHCTREQVTNAFLDLRRPDDNDNYDVKTFDEIDVTEFSDYNIPSTQQYESKSLHYETLQYLHKQGWLQLATSSVSFYLGSESKARYWVFPIENSATAEDGVTPLHDCPEPRWVEVSSKASPYYVNVAPGVDISSEVAKEAADPRTGTRIPNVRVLARLVNNTIQIPIHQSSQGESEVHFMGADASIFVTSDKNITDPHEVKYTAARSGNLITLIPAAGNKATLQIGKEYTMSVRMRDNKDKHRADDADCDVGKVYVKLLILPDIVQWTPTTPDKSWHNDANWTGYGTGMENYHYAPIAGSSVIIPAATQRSEVTTPELTVIANTAEDPHPYPMDANFALTPTCGQIYFQPGAMMLNQHLLQHDKALVDLIVPNQTWNTVAVPISSVVSGDMYIPHTGDENYGAIVAEKEPFTVGGFQGSRLSTSAFPFWISVYNKTVQKVNANPDKTGTTISTNTKVFASTNALDEPMQVGSGYQLLGYGPENFGASEPLTIRLPKPDNMYSYYYTDGSLGQNVSINRGANSNKLTYSPNVPITLTNESRSNSFMFGNPTMAMIDLTKCLPDGATIYKMVNDSWVSGTKVSLEMDEAYRYLEPMRSVLVTLSTPSTTAQIDLQAEDLTTPEKIAEAKTNNIAPRRNASGNTLQLMTIYADVYGTKARCLLGAKSGMADTYALGEDALFISSGVEAEVNSATATSPVNMYTVADNVPLMVDIRENIDTIPMALLIHDYYRTDKVNFTFHLTENWEKDCYFCDAVTGTKTLITDGLTLDVEMPQNHETRYFIDGPDVMNPDGGGDIWSSTEDVKTSTNQVWAYSPSQGQLVVASNDIIKAVTVYDIAGRLIGYRELEMQYNSTTFDTPTGACIVKAVLRDNTEHYISALVK